MVVRDVLYGYIELTPLARRIIDTSEFQSLRDLRQLGLASYVFPSANHTRFEHSLGVYHLAGQLLKGIAERQPNLFAQNPLKRRRLIELVQVAGLCHDLGHYAFSHMFDSHIARRLGVPEHEERGAEMFRGMVKRYDLPLLPTEVDFVVRLMLGDPTVRPSWLASVIHDREAQLDVDKLDYLNRDSFHLGFGRPIQIDRIIFFARVLRLPHSRPPQVRSRQGEKVE